MARRAQARPGLSYVEANGGRVSTYTFEQDVMDAKRNIERDFPGVRALWDNENHEHLLVGRDTDGTDYLIFASKSFHEDLIRARLQRADNTRSDPFEDVESYNEKVEAEHDRQLGEAMGDVGERLAHAFAADGLTVRPRMAPQSVSYKKMRRSAKPNYDIPNR